MTELLNRAIRMYKGGPIDPNLFSVAIRNCNVSEATFVAWTEYMRANSIQINDEFLLNSFQSLLKQGNAINSLLDIVDYFCENGEMSGVAWRRMMKMMDIEPSDVSILVSSRCTLVTSLLRYLNSHFDAIS